MAPYVCFNLLLGFLWILSNNSLGKYMICIKGRAVCKCKELLIVIAIIATSLFMGMRGPFTADHKSYQLLFDETSQRSFKDILVHKVYTERGFLFFNKFIGLFTGNADVFMCVESVVFIALIVKVARKYKNSDFILFLLLFVNAGIYFQSFNMIRQALAAGIVFVALRLLGNGNAKAYILVVILAMTVHTSSIIMLAVLPLLQLKVNKKNGLMMISIGGIVFFLIGKIVELVQRYRYANYDYGMGHGTINAFLVQWTLCIIVAIAIHNGAINIDEKHNIVLINSMWMYLVFSFATLSIYQMSRICYFFSTPMLILVSKAFEKWKGKFGILLRIGLVFMLILYSYVWLSGTGYDPYYTFLQT